MPIFRVEKNRGYTVMSNYHLKDKTLSLKSKGLLSVILSLPDEWNYTTRGLAAISKEGVDSIGSALKELETIGYLTRNRLRDSRGRIADTEYVVYEYPQPQPNPSTPPPNVGLPNATLSDTPIPNTTLPHPTPPDTIFPDTPSPYTENPYMDKPHTENPAQCITNKSLRATKESSTNQTNTQEQKHQHQRTSAVSVCPSNAGQLSLDDTDATTQSDQQNQQAECLTVQTAQGAGTSKPANHTMTLVGEQEPQFEQFEQFWQLYPRKAGKKAAKKAWLGIKPDESMFSIIMAALNTAVRYWNSNAISLKHIPHPSTWLNEERWEDEFPTATSTTQLSNREGMTGMSFAEKSTGGGETATIGANYRIGGEDDPYRELMS